MGVGDESLDAGEGGFVTNGVDPNSQRRVGRHRAGDHGVAAAAVDRSGLTGDHRLVDRGVAVDDRAIRGDTAAGADEHHVAWPQRAHCDVLDVTAGDAFCFVGQERSECIEGA